MNRAKAAEAESALRILRTREPDVGWSTVAVPARSRLYCLPPLGVGTAEVESLTSYINRLGWTYRVSPRVIVAWEIIPHLTGSHHLRFAPHHLGSFGRSASMAVNGASAIAVDWAGALNRLTMRSDLHHLTLHPWADGLPPFGLLRATPAWCSACYQEWHDQGRQLYQPLIWMLQALTVCPRHIRLLEERCPACQKHQSAISAHIRLGYCTQCAAWLGRPTDSPANEQTNDEFISWQAWVMNTVKELHQAGRSESQPSWELLPSGLAVCARVAGGTTSLARLAQISRPSLAKWLDRQRTPSFERVLQCCYVLGVRPLQMMQADPAVLQAALETRRQHRQPLPQRLPSVPVDYEQALKLIQAVLDGNEALLSVNQIERRLGLGTHILSKKFPHECAALVARYRTYRAEQGKRRLERTRHAVRQATLTLHEQGTLPTWKRVVALLPDPGMMRTPEGRATWHTVRRELGLEE